MKKSIIVIIAIGAFSAAYFYASQTPPAEAVTAPTAVASAATARVVLPVAKPVAPAITAPASIVRVSQSMADNLAPPSPRNELTTTIPELVRLISAQDFETLMQDFMPPDELDALLVADGQPGQPMTLPVLANLMRQNPKVMQQMAGAAQFLTYLQTQTPTFDATGESASYPLPKGINGMDSINFVKVGGNWYVKNGVQFFK